MEAMPRGHHKREWRWRRGMGWEEGKRRTVTINRFIINAATGEGRGGSVGPAISSGLGRRRKHVFLAKNRLRGILNTTRVCHGVTRTMVRRTRGIQIFVQKKAILSKCVTSGMRESILTMMAEALFGSSDGACCDPILNFEVRGNNGRRRRATDGREQP